MKAEECRPGYGSTGELWVVGTGIDSFAHITADATARIKAADKVFFGLENAVTAQQLAQLNPSAQALPAYDDTLNRRATYEKWVDVLVNHVSQRLNVCAVFYGHPGMFVYASTVAVRRARSAGYAAHLLPAVSAQDCLFADLLIDPASDGYACYDATDFLLHDRPVNVSSGLVLWQIAVIGCWAGAPRVHREGLAILARFLAEHYGEEHGVAIYEAANLPIFEPRVEWVALNDLPDAKVSLHSTLFVPAQGKPPLRSDMVDLLGGSSKRSHGEL